jgi:putative transposase
MKLRRVYRFKLEPNTEQTQKLYQLAGSRRFAYNWALARRNEFYKSEGKTIPAAQLSLELTQLKKKTETAWLKESDSQLLQQALKDVETAFQNFFAGRARFPKFRSRNKGHFAFRIPQRVKIEQSKVYCPKIGWVRMRQSQEIEGETKSATFKRDACGDWFLTLTAEFEMPDMALPEAQNPIGIDMGLHDFVVLSNGESTPAPRIFRKLEKKLGKAQRKLSRAKTGSNRRQDAKLRVAKVHRKIAECRADFVHKVSSDLVKRFDHIGIEDLNVKGMAKTTLAKSVNDAALGELRRQLEYKTLWNRRHLVKVSRWFPSSKMCGSCGALNDALTLSDRVWYCDCGAHHHRDQNAASNILRESLKIAVGHTEIKNAHGQNVRPATVGNSG